MFSPSPFAESRLDVLHETIRALPFATVVANTGQGLNANHLPLTLDASRGRYGVLQGHVARANPIWREAAAGTEALAVFHGPHHYVSPSWYPSKREHGRVVPTWNYIVVQARGAIEWTHDKPWLRAFLERLVQSQEGERENAWRIDDAPAEYLDRMLEAIVGFEIAVSAIDGKWKLSQNQRRADQAGVVAGLTAEPGDAATELARHMRSRGIGE